MLCKLCKKREVEDESGFCEECGKLIDMTEGEGEEESGGNGEGNGEGGGDEGGEGDDGGDGNGNGDGE